VGFGWQQNINGQIRLPRLTDANDKSYIEPLLNISNTRIGGATHFILIIPEQQVFQIPENELGARYLNTWSGPGSQDYQDFEDNRYNNQELPIQQRNKAISAIQFIESIVNMNNTRWMERDLNQRYIANVHEMQRILINLSMMTSNYLEPSRFFLSSGDNLDSNEERTPLDGDEEYEDARINSMGKLPHKKGSHLCPLGFFNPYSDFLWQINVLLGCYTVPYTLRSGSRQRLAVLPTNRMLVSSFYNACKMLNFSYAKTSVLTKNESTLLRKIHSYSFSLMFGLDIGCMEDYRFIRDYQNFRVDCQQYKNTIPCFIPLEHYGQFVVNDTINTCYKRNWEGHVNKITGVQQQLVTIAGNNRIGIGQADRKKFINTGGKETFTSVLTGIMNSNQSRNFDNVLTNGQDCEVTIPFFWGNQVERHFFQDVLPCYVFIGLNYYTIYYSTTFKMPQLLQRTLYNFNAIYFDRDHDREEQYDEGDDEIELQTFNLLQTLSKTTQNSQ
jgi:hypothetical protein